MIWVPGAMLVASSAPACLLECEDLHMICMNRAPAVAPAVIASPGPPGEVAAKQTEGVFESVFMLSTKRKRTEKTPSASLCSAPPPQARGRR